MLEVGFCDCEGAEMEGGRGVGYTDTAVETLQVGRRRLLLPPAGIDEGLLGPLILYASPPYR
jgi:hypothetical protein